MSTITTLVHSSDPVFQGLDIRAEFTLSLLATALSLKILDKPSLLAHTIYQTIVFDDAIRQGGFDIGRTMHGRQSVSAADVQEGKETPGEEWQGLTGLILRESGWFEHWVKGEKHCESAVDGA